MTRPCLQGQKKKNTVVGGLGPVALRKNEASEHREYEQPTAPSFPKSVSLSLAQHFRIPAPVFELHLSFQPHLSQVLSAPPHLVFPVLGILHLPSRPLPCPAPPGSVSKMLTSSCLARAPMTLASVDPGGTGRRLEARREGTCTYSPALAPLPHTGPGFPLPLSAPHPRFLLTGSGTVFSSP